MILINFSLFCSKFLDFFPHHNSLASIVLFPVMKLFNVDFLNCCLSQNDRQHLGLLHNEVPSCVDIHTRTHTQAHWPCRMHFLSLRILWLPFPLYWKHPFTLGCPTSCILLGTLHFFLIKILVSATASGGPVLQCPTADMHRETKERGRCARQLVDNLSNTTKLLLVSYILSVSRLNPTTGLYRCD